jgi:hypothetical protein
MDHHRRPLNHRLKQELVHQGRQHYERPQNLREVKEMGLVSRVRQRWALEWAKARAKDSLTGERKESELETDAAKDLGSD